MLREISVGKEKLFVHPKLIQLLSRDGNVVAAYGERAVSETADRLIDADPFLAKRGDMGRRSGWLSAVGLYLRPDPNFPVAAPAWASTSPAN